MMNATEKLQAILRNGTNTDKQVNDFINDFAYDILQAFETDQGIENTTGMDVYLLIRQLLGASNVCGDIEKQLDKAVESIVLTKQGRTVFGAAMKKQAALSKKNAIKNAPSMVVVPDQDYEEGSFSVIDDALGIDRNSDAATKIISAIDSFGEGTQTNQSFANAVEQLADANEEVTEEVQKKIQKSSPKAKFNKPFTSKGDLCREALSQIFAEFGNLEGFELDPEFLADKLDISISRCVSWMYQFTGNKVENLAQYQDILDEFNDSTNQYKTNLYNKVLEIITYSKAYDASVHGLDMDYDTLRLSQVVPHFYLNTRGYLADLSACSSGKSGTILVAPAELNAKVSVVIVENNTYTDMVKAFKKWYAPRKDFQIVDKHGFWKPEWMESERNVICIIDKKSVENTSTDKMTKKGLPSFPEYISNAGVELLICDEVHNFKGSNEGGTHDISEVETDATDDSHNHCSRAVHEMAVQSKYRLFSSATPLLNNFTELAKVLQMLLPATNTDKNYRHQQVIKGVNDKTKSAQDILKNAEMLYAPLHCVTTRVPRPDVEFEIIDIDNKERGYVNGKIVPMELGWLDTWTEHTRNLIEEEEDISGTLPSQRKYWSDMEQDGLFFADYLVLMEEQILSALKAGKQLCFYTNVAMRQHEVLKHQLLEIASKAGVALSEDEIELANGKHSPRLRMPARIQLDDGSFIEKTELARQVWSKETRVLIANNVIAVGMDGLQGTDRIKDCGRISEIFLLANPYHDAFLYQFRSRFQRTQGADSSKLPDCNFYLPSIWWDASNPGDDPLIYSRNDQTCRRIQLKGIKSQLVCDGEFPEGIKIEELANEVSDTIIAQVRDGLFNTEEAKKQRAEAYKRGIDSMGGK